MLRHVWKINLELRSSYFLLNSKRFKGHSHWQNTRHIKSANDLKKAQLQSRYLWKIQGAVNANQGDTNPETNSALAQVIEQAKKECVPVAALQSFLKKLTEKSVEPFQIYLRSPEKYVIAVTYDKKRAQYFRQALKKAIRDSKVSMLEIPNVDDVYTTKGFIVSKPPSQDITFEKVEEDAIIAGAEEVEEIESDNKEERVFQFITLQEDLWDVVKALREKGWVMYEHKHELVPLFSVELPEDKIPQVSNLVTALEEIPEVEKVVINIA